MDLDPQICYRASASRDARFDGRFFMGVTSTGIYCRPICPARMPKRGHCRYFRCAAEAQEAGFRPCLRCRPESSPGTPAWLGTSATVSRALRLINQGELERGGVDALARRLGVGSRHLRRLLQERLGASPVALEQTRRIQFAKKLIDETQLTMRQVALSSGFQSVRRFNAAFRDAYRLAPSELRRDSSKVANGGSLRLRLAYRPPLDWPAVLAFLGPRSISGVEEVDDDTYRRTVVFGDRAGVLGVSSAGDDTHLTLEVPVALAPDLSMIVDRVRGIFDLGADPDRINTQLGRDPRLRRSVRRRPGIRVPGGWSRFELAVRAILGQQVTVRGATTLAGRLVERFGRPLSGGEGALSRLFPEPERLASADAGEIGMPRARSAAIRSLARAVVDGSLELDASIGLDDAVARLRELPGLGEWTAQYIAMRALREPDAFPATDLGVRKALARADELPTTKQVLEHAEAWRPWRAYATMHLWMDDEE
jgi:AraC family transcriptional regulator of adaptative response / DNA-3-methyladenine glycosylase II